VYKLFEHFLFSRCGIKLGNNKHYLVANRLDRILFDSGLSSLDKLISRVCNHQMTEKIELEIIDAMTTNETYWFRELSHFNELAHLIAENKTTQKTQTFKVWSAACSSGQEPYSIAMALENYCNQKGIPNIRNFQILGTDISESVINIARRAVYSDLEITRGLDSIAKKTHFYNTHEGWKVSNSIRSRVRFQTFNLLETFFPLGQFDAIFCRNVLIYFPDDIKRDILSRMSNALKKGGVLFISNTEAMPINLDSFELVSNSSARYYRVKQ